MGATSSSKAPDSSLDEPSSNYKHDQPDDKESQLTWLRTMANLAVSFVPRFAHSGTMNTPHAEHQSGTGLSASERSSSHSGASSSETTTVSPQNMVSSPAGDTKGPADYPYSRPRTCFVLMGTPERESDHCGYRSWDESVSNMTTGPSGQSNTDGLTDVEANSKPRREVPFPTSLQNRPVHDADAVKAYPQARGTGARGQERPEDKQNQSVLMARRQERQEESENPPSGKLCRPELGIGGIQQQQLPFQPYKQEQSTLMAGGYERQDESENLPSGKLRRHELGFVGVQQEQLPLQPDKNGLQQSKQGLSPKATGKDPEEVTSEGMLQLLLQRKHSTVELLEGKRTQLQSHRQRMLDHDGHFQVKDAEFSRDKLVKRYSQLYDGADILSQELEELFKEQVSVIEESSNAVYMSILKASFDRSAAYFQTIRTAVEDRVKESNGAAASQTPDRSLGYDHLVKELLRGYQLTSVPYRLLDDISNRVFQCYHVKKLEGKLGICTSECPSTKFHTVLKTFGEKCAVVAWFLQLLPHKFSLSDTCLDFGFNAAHHIRHSLSEKDVEFISKWYWPALLMQRNSEEKVCVSKGIVLTTIEL